MNSTSVTHSRSVPFDVNLFINRQEIIKLFLGIVESDNRSHTKQYFDFNGISGQGKTDLLKWIYYHGKEKGYCAAYIDFEYRTYQRQEIFPILEAISKHLAAQISPDPFGTFQDRLSPYLREYEAFLKKQALGRDQETERWELDLSERKLIQVFNENFKFALRDHKIILCFDSTEKAYLKTLWTFEKQILKHYTSHRNFILVTAGQKECAWEDTAIKEMVERYELPPLDRKSVREQIKKLKKKNALKFNVTEPLLTEVVRLTQGHPFSTYKLISFWTEDFTRNIRASSIAGEPFAEGIGVLIRGIIEERILENFQLTQEHFSILKILRYLAPLRSIDLSMFEYVLTTFLPEWFGDKKVYFFQKLWKEFQETYIFSDWRDGGFAFNPIVRNILWWDMKINDSDKFVEVQDVLAERYKNLISKTSSIARIKNIVERFYHLAILLQSRGFQKTLITSEIINEIGGYLASMEVNELDQLYNTLKHDRELKELIEMKRVLSLI